MVNCKIPSQYAHTFRRIYLDKKFKTYFAWPKLIGKHNHDIAAVSYASELQTTMKSDC